MTSNRSGHQNRSRLFPTPWYFNVLVSAGVGLAFALLVFTPLLRNADHRLYDTLLHLRPPVSEKESILLVNIGDPSVRRQGEWPWQRRVIAEGLWLMSEFAPESVVLDFDYSDRSPVTLNPENVEGSAPDIARQELDELSRNIEQLRSAFERSQFTPQSAAPLLGDLAERTQSTGDRIVSVLAQARVDNDEALADAVAANGTVSLPIFLSDGETGPPETREEKARSQFALSAVQKHGSLRSWSHVTPMIDPLLEATRHAGFANTVIDPDGVTRSAHLYATDGKAVYGQLVMPLFHRLAGVTEVRASPERFVLETRDEAIRIPRRDDGSVLIDWPQKDYDDSFRQIAYTRILDAQELEEDLAFNLREMQRAGYFSYGSTDTTPTQLLESVRSLRNEIRETQNWDLINEYRELKRAYLAVAGRFLNGQALQRMTEEIETRRNQEGVSESERTRLSELEREVESVFAETRKIYDALSKQRSRLQSALADSVVFVGFTATATTDIGVTPFDSTYVNLGIHASLLNTLMTRSFLDYTPRWSAALLAFLAPIGLGVIVRGRRPVHHVIVGLGSIAGLVALAVGVFVVLDIYVPIVGLLAAAGLTLGLLTVVRLLETERDKRWLHGAFEHYISAEFINELIQDPSKLELGGREQELTAMFSDIRRFTRIAEALAPTELVSLLNQYLTNMSDVLLDESATIDKYEGDAIVAFFGAPISLTDHARRACEAALRMKAAEEELNRQVLRDGLSPQPLYTRIGINTGPMVVGNLGTLRRMDYTVMGHQANVAARLETANKLYGTSTLVSESTYRVVSETFMFRRLDRVRFPGLQEPVRLFQLLAHVGEETPILNEALEIFDDGLSAYERGEFAYAEERFEQERRLYPNDGAAMLFEQRCASMRDSDVPEDWDGVTTLESKL